MNKIGILNLVMNRDRINQDQWLDVLLHKNKKNLCNMNINMAVKRRKTLTVTKNRKRTRSFPVI